LLGRVGRTDAGKNGSVGVPDVQRELQELVGALDELGRHDARDAQIDPSEIFDGDLRFEVGHGVLRNGGNGRRGQQ